MTAIAEPVAETSKSKKTVLPEGMNELKVFWFFIATILTLLLALLDQSIVSSAVLPIVSDLDPAHGIDQFPWLITTYMLAATACQPLYGRLSDAYGPKAVLLGALVAFFLGSGLCSLATNMTELIVFRAIQGIGGGGLMSMILIVSAVIYPPKARASGASMGGGLIAVGMIAGPMVGGPLSSFLSWRWIFYINLPLVLAAIVITAWALRLPSTVRTKQRIDYLGALLVVIAACGLLLAAKELSTAGHSPVTLSVLTVIGLAASVGFVLRQRHSADPLLPLSLFRDPVFRVTAPLQFIAGFALLSLPVFVITYLSVVRGVPTSQTGLQLLPMAAGVAVVFTVWGRWISKIGRCKPILVTNTVIALLATVGLALVPGDVNLVVLDGLLVLLGAGIGGVTQVALFTAQAAAAPERMGVITTAGRFATNLGVTFGGAILGAVLTMWFSGHVAVGGDPDALLAKVSGMHGAARASVVDAFSGAVGVMLAVASAVLAIGVLLAMRMRDVTVSTSEDKDVPCES